MLPYYQDKIDTLREIFNSDDVEVFEKSISIDGRSYDVVEDVIILLGKRWKRNTAAKLRRQEVSSENSTGDIQYTFGAEWQKFPELLPEHQLEFEQYFDVLPVDEIKGKRVCDLGCGSGRWSSFLSELASEVVLVDFSEAIFVARRNLASCPNAIFIMADLTDLPFGDDFCDLVICIGVLHHLERNALVEARSLARFAPKLLLYLYSALDARPAYYRVLLPLVSLARAGLSRITSSRLRDLVTWVGLLLVYRPLIALGYLMRPFGLAEAVPLYDFYRGKSTTRIRQDVYDRFFTRIEQRFTKAEIATLGDTFQKVVISEEIPYWHFLCKR